MLDENAIALAGWLVCLGTAALFAWNRDRWAKPTVIGCAVAVAAITVAVIW